MSQSSDLVGVILAAGVGSRLRPMGNDKPKCLITIAGKAILQHQLDSYIAAGVKELIIIVGYEVEKNLRGWTEFAVQKFFKLGALYFRICDVSK